jgi:hypothetical protein
MREAEQHAFACDHPRDVHSSLPAPPVASFWSERGLSDLTLLALTFLV